MDLVKLQELIDQKYISCVKHPVEDLWIYNYTQKCQFDKMWTPETMECRGLIMDAQHNIVARPFKKFWNLSEHQETASLPPLPVEPFEVFEKMDGSLIIITRWNQKNIIATRGSFESDQALKAQEILKKKYPNFICPDGLTCLYELIYKENRIVVDYGNIEDIFLLAVIETDSGREKSYEEISIWAGLNGFPIVKRHDGIRDIKEIKDLYQQTKNSV